MKVGVQSGGIFDSRTAEEGMKLLHDCGFDCVDLNIDIHLPGSAIKKGPLTDFFDKSVEDLEAYFRPYKEAAKKHSITFSQMHGPFPMYIINKPDINAYMIMATEKCMAVAKYLGCPYIVVHPVGLSRLTSKENEHEVNMKIYRALIPAAKKYGVKVCLENLFTSYHGRNIEGPCSQAAEAVSYIDALNAEAKKKCFAFCFDVGHSNLLSQDMYETITTLGKRIQILHIHDNDGNNDLHMMPYTYRGKDLITDWDGLIRGLKDVGYQGVLSFETFRVMASFPKEVHKEVLSLLSALGRYFSAEIG